MRRKGDGRKGGRRNKVGEKEKDEIKGKNRQREGKGKDREKGEGLHRIFSHSTLI